MTDETDQAVPESGSFPASVTPDVEDVAPDTTPDVAEEESETPETPEKPKGGFQRRIAELVEQRNEERRAREATERRLDQLVEMMMARQEPEKAPEPPQMPTLEQHEYDEKKYQAAVIEYAKAEARREAQEALKADRAQQAAQARQTTFKTREAEFAKATPDYQSVVYDPAAPISETMAEIIAESAMTIRRWRIEASMTCWSMAALPARFLDFAAAGADSLLQRLGLEQLSALVDLEREGDVYASGHRAPPVWSGPFSTVGTVAG